jgi:DNA-binding Lrp family transcriptional regulator
MFTAFVMIQAEPDKIAEIARSIANMPNVAEVYSVTGDFDILVVLRLSEFEQLAESVPDGLSRIEGILRTSTVLAFRRFSAEDLEAAWDIGVS